MSEKMKAMLSRGNIENRVQGGPDLLSIATLFLTLVSSISVVSLAIDWFRPSAVLFMALFATVVLAFVWSRDGWSRKGEVPSGSTGPSRSNVKLMMIVSFGFVFRWPPYNFLQGGQDQGLYMNMSAVLKKWGELRFPDPVRAGLSDSLRAIYDQTLLSSYYVVDKVRSTAIIEFYPLHPALMSVFSTVVGGAGEEVMVLMGLMTVWASWHLGLEVDGRTRAADVFALLMAVNPAVSFFSKFPVSETAATTFVVLGFLFLLRFMRSDSRRDQIFNLGLALSSFNALFYVRWQFLLYIPFFVTVLVVGALIPSLRSRTRRIAIFTLPAVGLFGLSMIFYRIKLIELYNPVKNSIIDMIPTTSVFNIVTVLGAVICVLVVAAVLANSTAGRRGAYDPYLQRAAGWSLLVALCASIPSLLDLYRGKSMYPWGYPVPVESDSWVIRFHVLYRLALFASPWLLILAVVAGVIRRPRNWSISAAYLFVALCWVGILLRPYVPYLYYYGRYLVVDMTPGVLLLGSVALVSLWRGRLKWIGAPLLAATVAYFSLFSAVQMGHREGDVGSFFERLVENVSTKDVLVVSSISQQVIVPLRATYGLTVVGVPEPADGVPTATDVINAFSAEARRRGGRLLFLGGEGQISTGARSLGVFKFTDSYITNTDHFRGGGLSNFVSKRRLLLPFEWQSYSFNWELYDVSS